MSFLLSLLSPSPIWGKQMAVVILIAIWGETLTCGEQEKLLFVLWAKQQIPRG